MSQQEARKCPHCFYKAILCKHVRVFLLRATCEKNGSKKPKKNEIKSVRVALNEIFLLAMEVLTGKTISVFSPRSVNVMSFLTNH